MTNEQFKNLSFGDVVRNLSENEGFIVQLNDGARAYVLRSATLTTPDEWLNKEWDPVNLHTLQIGDVVRSNKLTERGWIVVGETKVCAYIVQAEFISDSTCNEWMLVVKCHHEQVG